MRKLSGKTINSLALCVALAAPLVYLFGTLFMSLAGAHGEMNLAQAETNVQTFELTKDNIIEGYRLNAETGQPEIADHRYAITPYFKVEGYATLTYVQESSPKPMGYAYWYSEDYTYIERIYFDFATQTYLESATGKFLRIQIYSNGDMNFQKFELTAKSLAPYSYTQFLFSQFFAYDNFLAESGREVLDGTPLYGFEPIGELVRFTDSNMLHLGNLPYGPLVIGYTYYCAHVIIVDLIFYIGSFIPRLIKKTINKLEGGLE